MPTQFNLPYAVIATIVDSFGVLSNLAILFFLVWNQFGSKLTMTLMKSQFIFDASVSLYALLSLWIPDWHFNNVGPLSIFFCFIWVSRVLFWFLTMLSQSNLTCIVLDRVRGIAFPASYKQHERLTLVAYYSVTIAYSFAISMLSIFTVTYSKSAGCQHTLARASRADLIYHHFASVTWLITSYLLPGSLMALGNCWLVYALHGRLSATGRSLPPLGRSTTSSDQRPSGVWIVAPAIAMWLAFLLTHAYAAIFNLLVAWQIIDYRHTFVEARVGILLTIVNSACNPLILVVSSPPFRRRLYACVKRFMIFGQGQSKVDEETTTGQFTELD